MKTFFVLLLLACCATHGTSFAKKPGKGKINMFSSEAVNQMDSKEFNRRFGDPYLTEQKGHDITIEEARERLFKFYTFYDLEDKLSNVEAILLKYKGNYENMMRLLYRKYANHIQSTWQRKGEEGLELGIESEQTNEDRHEL